MKNINRFCMAILLLCVSFIVINIQYTQEINRLRDLGRTDFSFHFYLRNANQSTEEALGFLQQVSKNHQVSIIKTDSNQSIIKAGVFHTETFPYQEFGISSLQFNQDDSGSYVNADSSDKLGHIPTFLTPKEIKLITLKSYFRDKGRTLNGQYTVTSTQAIDKEAIVSQFSLFFDIDEQTLLEPSFEVAVELLNRDLLLTSIIVAITFLLLILTTSYRPIMEMKKIGVAKLLGYNNLDILFDFIKDNLIILASGSVLINLLPYLLLDYIPKSFSGMMVLAHFILLQTYLLINLLVFLLIQRITVSSMIKGFSTYRVGFYINNLLKVGMTLLISALMIGVGNSMYHEHIELAYQEQWETQGNYLTLETVKASNQLWQESLSGSDQAHQYYYDLYRKLSEKAPVHYIRSTILNPNLLLSSTEIDQYQLEDQLEILYANQGYLESKGFPVTYANQASHLFFPESMRTDKEKVIFIAKFIAFQSLKYEDQKQTSIENMDVTISYYDQDWDFFPFSESITENFQNPIISLVNNDQMNWEDKAYLSSTGLSNPIKIENQPQYQEAIEQVIQSLPDGSYFKFSSLQSIQQGKIDTYRDATRNFTALFVILAILSLIISYFILISMFVWRKSYICTMKFLGWSLFDRYKSISIGLSILYLLPLPIIALFGHSIFPLLLYLIFSILDFAVFLILAYRMEGKNISLYLKGDSL